MAMISMARTRGRIASRLARTRLSDLQLDTCLSIGLFLGALAIRLPNLLTIPYFTDETAEVLQSLKIARGTLFPLTNADPYYGAIYNYIIGGVFYIFGPSVFSARLTVTVLGALTVPLAYFLGKTLQDRSAGVLVGLMMLTSAALILNGHIAWENNTSPFFATATLLALAMAIKRGSGQWLVTAGFLYGLTLQTHPGMIILAPGLLVYFICVGLFQCRSIETIGRQRSLMSWVKSPWPALTVVASAIGVGNVIAQNILQPESSWIAAQRHTYAFEPTPTLETYGVNLQGLVLMLLQMAGSNFDRRASFGENFLSALTVLSLTLLVVGIIYSLRRRLLLPVAVLSVTVLILPYFNKSYGYPGATRYVGYLYPLIYFLIAAPLAYALNTEARKRGISSVYIGLLALFITLWPALSLWGYYRSVDRAGNTNERVLSIDQKLHERYAAGEIAQVVIDNRLSQVQMGGGAQVQRALDYLFTLDATPHSSVDITTDKIGAELLKAAPQPLALVLADEESKALSEQFSLASVEITGPNPGKIRYGAYILNSPTGEQK